MHAVEPGIDALRAPFAKGVSARSSALLLQARDEGLEYESVTRAVARIASAVAIYAALRPVFGLGHELVVAGLAWLFRAAVGTGFWEPLIRWLGLDPIYTGAAIRAAGGVRVAGFAVAAPPGDALHAALPTLFLDPDRLADGAAISMVASAGAPAIGRALAAFGHARQSAPWQLSNPTGRCPPVRCCPRARSRAPVVASAV